MEKITQLIKNFEKRNNISIYITHCSDGSGTVYEFWEDEELKKFNGVLGLTKFLQDTQYELAEDGKCISPVTAV